MHKNETAGLSHSLFHGLCANPTLYNNNLHIYYCSSYSSRKLRVSVEGLVNNRNEEDEDNIIVIDEIILALQLLDIFFK